MEESGSNRRVTFLHGDLDLKIIKARRLPNMDVVSDRFRLCFTACGAIKYPSRGPASEDGNAGDAGGDREVHHHRKIITSDPYVTVCVPQAIVARTCVIKNSQSPCWNERFNIPLAHPVIDLEFQVKDNDVFGWQLIGTVKIPAEKVATDEVIR